MFRAVARAETAHACLADFWRSVAGYSQLTLQVTRASVRQGMGVGVAIFVTSPSYPDGFSAHRFVPGTALDIGLP